MDRASQTPSTEVYELEADTPFIPSSHKQRSNSQDEAQNLKAEYAVLRKHSLRWLPSLLVSFGLALGVGLGSQDIYSDDSGCLPNGRLGLISDSSSVWNIDELLTINVRLGSLPFATAKLIDVTWDIVVGRCGQIAIVLVLSRVFMPAILYTMESTLVTCETFAATAYGTGSFDALWTYTKDVLLSVGKDCNGNGVLRTVFDRLRSFRAHPRPGKSKSTLITLTIMVITSLYAIAFPTIVSAMTGYQSTTTALVVAPDGSRFPAANLTSLPYIVYDADRVGYSANLNITETMLKNEWSGIAEYYKAAWNFSDTPATLNQTSSVLFVSNQTYDLPSPYLNVWASPADYWTANNITYDRASLARDGVCEPNKTYQWGFSFLLLFIFTITTFTFVVLIYILSFRTILCSRSAAYSKDYGKYRASLALAAAVQDCIGPGVEDMSEREIQKALVRRSGGLEVEVERLPPSRGAAMTANIRKVHAAHDHQRRVKVRKALDEIERDEPGTLNLMREFLTVHHTKGVT